MGSKCDVQEQQFRDLADGRVVPSYGGLLSGKRGPEGPASTQPNQRGDAEPAPWELGALMLDLLGDVGDLGRVFRRRGGL